MRLKVFVDFDGTVTAEDVGDVFFRTFGGPHCDSYTGAYRDGRISARECFRSETAAIRSLDEEAAGRFLKEREMTAGFPEFVGFCAGREIGLHILSDGLDYYITTILQHHNLGSVPFSSNVFTVSPPGPDGRSAVSIAFPHSDVDCDRCACCKRNLMLTMTGDDDFLAYVGDGYSDRCVARYADVVFAKGDLQRFCQESNISHYLYRSFHDVQDRLGELLDRRTLRKRRSAQLLRNQIFLKEP